MKNWFSQLQTSKKSIAAFCNKNQIDLMIVFGSFAKAKTHPQSDLDLAIQFEKPAATVDSLEMTNKLTKLFHNQFNIDLVVLSSSTGYVLRNEIFSKGRPLYEKESGLFSTELWKAWTLLQDAKPIFTRHHKAYMEQFLKKLTHVA